MIISSRCTSLGGGGGVGSQMGVQGKGASGTGGAAVEGGGGPAGADERRRSLRPGPKAAPSRPARLNATTRTAPAARRGRAGAMTGAATRRTAGARRGAAGARACGGVRAAAAVAVGRGAAGRTTQVGASIPCDRSPRAGCCRPSPLRLGGGAWRGSAGLRRAQARAGRRWRAARGGARRRGRGRSRGGRQRARGASAHAWARGRGQKPCRGCVGVPRPDPPAPRPGARPAPGALLMRRGALPEARPAIGRGRQGSPRGAGAWSQDRLESRAREGVQRAGWSEWRPFARAWAAYRSGGGGGGAGGRPAGAAAPGWRRRRSARRNCGVRRPSKARGGAAAGRRDGLLLFGARGRPRRRGAGGRTGGLGLAEGGVPACVSQHVRGGLGFGA
jgi:hypothetical protein